MNPSRIPIELDPGEIRLTEGAVESTWVPGDSIGKFQEWTRYLVRMDAIETPHEKASSLAVSIQPAIQNHQFKFNPLKSKPPVETFDTIYGPFGKNESEIEILTTSQRSLDGILVWSNTDGYELNEASVAALFPEHDRIERQGTAWVVYEIMLTTEERAQKRSLEEQQEKELKEKVRNRFNVPDLRTGEMVHNISMEAGSEHVLEERVGKALFRAMEETKSSTKRSNISTVMRTCDQEGPFVGFKKLFTPQQISNLHCADAQLTQECFEQLRRLRSGHIYEELITKIDHGIDTHIISLIEKLREGPTKKSIEDAVQTWKENLENPYRNLGYRQTDPENIQETSGLLHTLNSSYFSICSCENSTGNESTSASFNHFEILLHASNNNNEYTFMDAIGVIHEITHRNQMRQMLEPSLAEGPGAISATIQKYYDDRPKNEDGLFSDVNDECETFANMVELFEARLGDGTYSDDEILTELRLPDTVESRSQVYQLSRCTALYVQGGGRSGNRYPREFVNFVVATYKKHNKYVRNGSRDPVLLEEAGPDLLQYLYKQAV